MLALARAQAAVLTSVETGIRALPSFLRLLGCGVRRRAHSA